MIMSDLMERLQRRMWVFPAISLLTVIIGQMCKERCAYLQGDILGVDLNLFGILFYSALLIGAAVYTKYYANAWLLKAIAAVVSAGVGAELILIKFQVQHNVYCPKCLISGFFFMLLFVIVARRLRKWVVILMVLLGALFTSFSFNGAVIPSYADEIYPEFGRGGAQTEVVVYSDYLCPACRGIDEQTSVMLGRLKDKVKIKFVDVPLHSGSLEYAEVFLYSWFSSGNNLETALKVRGLLFEAAKTKTDQAGLLAILKTQGVPFRVDKERAREIFRGFYNPLMKTDKITATPTVVVVTGGNRKGYVGGKDIMQALTGIQGM